MSSANDLLEANRTWAQRTKAQDPSFFAQLAEEQTPRHLWIGCSDSRVPAAQVTGAGPGDLFVHRNVGNVVDPTDFNGLSVLQYAVEALKVENIIVCGHYGCGGVKAALQDDESGLVGHWIRPIQDVMRQHRPLLDRIDDEQERGRALCELNVIEQVARLCQTALVQDAWKQEQDLTILGWIYELATGRLRDLNVTVSAATPWEAQYEKALSAVAEQ